MELLAGIQHLLQLASELGPEFTETWPAVRPVSWFLQSLQDWCQNVNF